MVRKPCSTLPVALLVWTLSLWIGNCSPHLPTLPRKFSTTLEAVIVNKNYSMTQREFYDYDANRIRLIRRTPRSSSSLHTLHLYTHGIEFTWSEVAGGVTNCVGSPVSPSRSHSTTTRGHIRPSGDFLGFGDASSRVYMGTGRARGILCDKWQSSTTITGTGEWNLTYYFAAARNWNLHGSMDANIDTVPVRAELVGWRSFPQPHNFRHLYEFVDWSTKAPESMFLPPSRSCNISSYCAGTNPSSDICEGNFEFLVHKSSTQVCHRSSDVPSPRCPLQNDDDRKDVNAAVAAGTVGAIVGCAATLLIVVLIRKRNDRLTRLAHDVEVVEMPETCVEAPRYQTTRTSNEFNTKVDDHGIK